MRYCAVIDTNVLVSAMLKWNSVPGTVMALAFDGPITPILSKEILTEYRAAAKQPDFYAFRSRRVRRMSHRANTAPRPSPTGRAAARPTSPKSRSRRNMQGM